MNDSSDTLFALWLAILLMAGGAALAAGRAIVQGTTLVAAWAWAVIALGGVVAVEAGAILAIESPAPAWVSVLRYSAALLTLGPAMAVLGAKRPQHRAWQFIVLSLLVVLALPAWQALAFGFGSSFVLPPAWAVFLGALVAVGTINHLPTRFAASSVLTGAGQACLLANYQPWFTVASPDILSCVGLSLLVLAAVAAAVRRSLNRHDLSPLDRLWLDFRDLVGTAWGLRIVERFNAESRRQGWNITLSWHGLADDSGEKPALSPEVEQAARRSLVSLVGLFASPSWIAERLPEA